MDDLYWILQKREEYQEYENENNTDRRWKA